MSELLPCPCGEIPTALNITDANQGSKWAFASGNCCGEWTIEFRTQYRPIDGREVKHLAYVAWNDSPRGTPQWQPIETAPRDGTHILGYWKTMRITDYPAVLYKDDCFLNPNAFSFVGKVELEEVFPTHWMPLPTPPKDQP